MISSSSSLMAWWPKIHILVQGWGQAEKSLECNTITPNYYTLFFFTLVIFILCVRNEKRKVAFVVTINFWQLRIAVAVKGVEELTIHQRISGPQNRITLNLVVVRVEKYQKHWRKTSHTPFQKHYKCLLALRERKKVPQKQKQFIISQR